MKAAAQLHVRTRAEEALNGPIEFRGSEVARADDGPRDTEFGERAACIIQVGAPAVGQAGSPRLVRVAHDPRSSVAEIRVLGQQGGDTGRLVARADEQHRSEKVTQPTPIGEPGAVPAPRGHDQEECERGAEQDLSRRHQSGDRGGGEREQRYADATASQTLELEYPYRADA